MALATKNTLTGWIGKALLGLLVVSFVGWGVGDVFRGYRPTDVATVAGKPITIDAFQRVYEAEFNRLQVQYNGRLSREMARQQGLESQVLSRMVSDAILDAQASDMKLGISDQAILDLLQRDPSFQDSSGAFDPAMFAEILRSNNLSEQAFMIKERGFMLRAQVSDSVLAEPKPPALLIEAVNRFREESRTFSFVTIPVTKAPPVPEPDEAKLKDYHLRNKIEFSTREFRKFQLVVVTPDALKKPDDISDADVKAAYDARIAQFSTPERRTVQQIPFKTVADAEKAYKEVSAGKDFLALAKELGLKETDVNLGSQTKETMLDATIANAAFSLARNEVSKPVEGALSVVLVRAIEIAPATLKTLDQVKGDLRDMLARERATDDAQTVVDKIEAARAKNASLKEAAEKVGMKPIEISESDRKGLASDGKPIPSIPEAARILSRVFETDVGVESDAIELAGGGSAWIDVQGVTPRTLRPFEEAKADVRASWMKAETERALQTFAQVFAERLRKGEPIAAIATEIGGAVQTSPPSKRGQPSDILPPAAINMGFSLPKSGGAGHVETKDGQGRILLQVAEDKFPSEIERGTAEKLSTELSRQALGDLAQQYNLKLRERYRVSINTDVLARATGQTTQE